MLKSEIRAELYRANAAAAAATAEACRLERHREQHIHSAAAWSRLADHEDRRTQAVRDLTPRQETAPAPRDLAAPPALVRV